MCSSDLAPAVTDLLGGQIKVAITALPPVTPHVRAGKLRALAVTTLQRSGALPEVPTIAESGYPGFFVDNMYGVVVAAKTSRARVEGLHAAIARAVNAPDVKEKLIAQGYDPLANTPAEFSIYLKAEVAKWAKVVKDSSLKAD